MLNVLPMPSLFLACKLFPSGTICEADVNIQKRQAGNVMMELRLNYEDLELLHCAHAVVFVGTFF